jgi:hypothetical protein
MSRFLLFSTALFALSFQCQANLLTNGSFEDPASAGAPSLAAGSTYLTGWTVVNAEIAQICPGCFSVTASDGAYSLDLAGYHDNTPFGGVAQTIATTPGDVYSISFDVNSLAGTTSIAVTAGDLSDIGSSSAPFDTWTTYSGFFTALDDNTPIELIGSSSGNNTYVGLDNVVVNFDHAGAAPEPSTILLLLAGALLLPAVRQRARR